VSYETKQVTFYGHKKVSQRTNSQRRADEQRYQRGAGGEEFLPAQRQNRRLLVNGKIKSASPARDKNEQLFFDTHLSMRVFPAKKGYDLFEPRVYVPVQTDEK